MTLPNDHEAKGRSAGRRRVKSETNNTVLQVEESNSGLDDFTRAVKQALRVDHRGDDITPISYAGIVETRKEDGKVYYCVTLRLRCDQLLLAKRVYQQQQPVGHNLISIQAVMCELNGEQVHRTLLEYTCASITMSIEQLRALALKGGKGKKVVEVIKTEKKRSRGRRPRKKTTIVENVVVGDHRGMKSNRRMHTAQFRRGRSAVSDAGEAWLQLYLNPMGREEPEMAGIPDGSAVKSVLAEYRNDTDFTFPTTVWTQLGTDATWAETPVSSIDAIAAAENFHMMIGVLPVASNVCVMRIYMSDPTTFKTMVSDANLGSKFYDHQTYPNWTAYDSGGAVLSDQSAFTFMETYIRDTRVATHIEQSAQYRLVTRGLTGTFTAPELKNEGFVTSAQIECKTYSQNTYSTVDSTSVVTGTVKVINLGDVTKSALVNTYHNAYSAKAVEGFYMPLLNTTRDWPFAPPLRADLAAITAWSESSTEPTLSKTFTTDYMFDDWNTGIIWFSGITRDCAIRLKSRMIMQLVPCSGADIGFATRANADEDFAAQELAYTLRNKMSHAYPSSYNDFGILGKIIGGLVESIPVIGKPIAAIGKGILGMFGNSNRNGQTSSASEAVQSPAQAQSYSPSMVGMPNPFSGVAQIPQYAMNAMGNMYGTANAALMTQMMNRMSV